MNRDSFRSDLAPLKHTKDQAVFGAFEWASSTVNILQGCRNSCKYCYARATAARFGVRNPSEWRREVRRTAAISHNYRKRTGTIMFPSSHDLQFVHIREVTHVLQNLLRAGNRVLVVSKPRLAVVEHLCCVLAEYKEQILFRFSIGSADDRTLKFWEPHAPSYHERIRSLEHAFRTGFSTSVSCEPMLDCQIERVIDQTIDLASDSVWVGKPNHLLGRISCNQENDEQTIEAAHMLLESLSEQYIRKLYSSFKKNQKVKWKESIKRVLGLPVSATVGADR